MVSRDMSVIEAALQPNETTPTVSAPQPNTDMLPVSTPITDTVAPKKRRTRTKKTKEEVQTEAKPDEEGQNNQPPTPAPAPNSAPSQDPQTQTALNAVQLAINSARGIMRNIGVRLENIPTPGSIALPLILLLVFFFLLIPVNGHTRFTWLWLVVSGDASTAIASNVSSGTVSRTDTSTPNNNDALLAPIGNAPVPVMTGVEDV